MWTDQWRSGAPTVSHRAMTPLVLIHGGSFAASCWELLTPLLEEPALAVDLPGRGANGPPGFLTIRGAAASVTADVDAAGFDEVILVGHSMAGCSLPATIAQLGERVRHVVFVACTVPENGHCCIDTLPEGIQVLISENRDAPPSTMDETMARAVFGNDLDDEQFAWCMARMVPEGLTLLFEPVDLAPLRSPVPRTWIRPLRDAIVRPDAQRRFAANVGHCDMIDIDAGHMCMISKPVELADILNRIAGGVSG